MNTLEGPSSVGSWEVLVSRQCLPPPLQVLFGDDAEIGVGDLVDGGGISAGEGLRRVDAGKGVLAEYGVLATHEGEVGHLRQLYGRGELLNV